MGFANLSAVERIDRTFYLVFGISFGMLLLITVLTVCFVIRYRRSRHPEPVEILSNWRLELLWTLTSEDVIHSLFIPAFRLKKDAVPGMRTQAWFQPQTEGTYEIFCAAYCGSKHYDMRADLVVASPEQFSGWSAGQVETSALLSAARSQQWAAAPPGLRVLEKYGCLKCHSLDGRRDVGPTLKGLAGSTVSVVRRGQHATITVDEEYLTRAIEDPAAEVVVGCDAIMPASKLPPDEMRELLDYLESLR
jgi:cytochrome c oxidase subunit 2